MHRTAFRGVWRPVMDFLRDAVAAQTSVRDYIEGEKVLHGFLAAYLSIADYYVIHTGRVRDSWRPPPRRPPTRPVPPRAASARLAS